MEQFFFRFAFANLIGVLFFAIMLFIRMRSVRSLKATPLADDAPCPIVSMIVAARNEQQMLRQAIIKLLKQDYPHLEVIAVDDRSDDDTGVILDQLAKEEPRLKVVHVSELPAGWLGKTHALWLGAKLAKGELLLFTDADIMMDPATIRSAVARMQEIACDHLTLAPHMVLPGWFLNAFLGVYMFFFNLHVRPWKARDPNSRCHVGVGAFQLMRADTYEKIGTFEAIRMRPDDDMKLGKLVKIHGFRQEFEFGCSLISVRWYSSIRELIDGLTKNAFSAVDYRIVFVSFGLVMQAVFCLLPVVGMWLPIGPGRWFYLATVLVFIISIWDMMRRCGARAECALGFPLALPLYMYILFRAMLLNVFQGGIVWRGTKYPLNDLKANKIDF